MNAVAASRFLKPALLARLGSLELVARTVVDGVLTGLHKSPDFGFSQEFAEYRAYNEGDDLRFVDWNVYARTDRMYSRSANMSKPVFWLRRLRTWPDVNTMHWGRG